jgi:hypothetical protein
MENLEITTIEDGKRIYQVPTAAPANSQLFERNVNTLYESAQLNVAAFDSLMGKEESSGSTFRGQERLVAQGRGWHDRRRGQRAKFIEEIYRDWIIPDIVREINKGKEFLATLSTEEMMWVAEQMSVNLSNERIKEIVLDLKIEDITPEKLQSLAQMKDILRNEIMKKGNRQLVEVLKDEFKDIEVKIGINIAGKQKNLSAASDKILSILEVAMTNPQFKQNLEANGMIGPFNDLLEYSGLNPVAFNTMSTAQANPQAVMSPVQPKAPVAPQV